MTDTLLSPHGEGYCRWCRFIVGLSAAGLLEPHRRGNNPGPGTVCKGGNTKPPKRMPYSSRNAAFKTKSEKAACPVCERPVATLTDGRLASHFLSDWGYIRCRGGYSPAR